MSPAPSQSSLSILISSKLDAYLSSFNAGDFPAASSHYAEPSTFISATSSTVLFTRADFAQLMAWTVKRLREDGFERSEWAGGEKKIIVLDPKGSVLASCVCRRLGGGSVCEEFTALYTLRKAGEGEADWEIVAIYTYPIETVLG